MKNELNASDIRFLKKKNKKKRIGLLNVCLRFVSDFFCYLFFVEFKVTFSYFKKYIICFEPSHTYMCKDRDTHTSAQNTYTRAHLTYTRKHTHNHTHHPCVIHQTNVLIKMSTGKYLTSVEDHTKNF